MTAPLPPTSDPARSRLAGLFPSPTTSDRPWWRRRSRAVVAVALVVVLLGTGLVARAFGSATAGYRTTLVTTRDVDSLVSGVATFEPVSQATIAFPVSGTVASIRVALGDSVTVGQTLASLDPADLVETLHEQQATLAEAELTLARALAGDGASDANGSADSSTPIALTAVRSAGVDAALTAAQHAVLEAQQQVDAALAVTDAAFDAASTVCAEAGVDPSGTPPTTSPTASALSACQAAVATVLTAQTDLRTAQSGLVAASTALDALLTDRAVSAADAEAPSSGGAAESAPDGSTAPSGLDGASPTSPSAAELIALQKAVDAAAGQVAVAEQAIEQADIASPIAGTVVGLDLAVGESVTGGSTTQHVVVVGDGGYEAVTTVSVDEIAKVEVGQRATLVPDGTTASLDASVAAISATPDATASTTSYRVVLGFSDAQSTQAAAEALQNGSTGAVAIVAERATSALAVPTSAVTSTGDRHTVTTLDGSTPTVVPVEVGVVGATWTEITSGLDDGDEVVLADLGAPLPGSATESSPDAEIPGGFPTGQMPDGGFRIGGPPG